MTQNYLHLTPRELDQPVYRIFPVHRLYELFDHRQNVLVRPSKWHDPFENFILNSRARASDGSLGEFGFRNDLYGQCWTLQSASDAMWRIYSPDSDAVRVRSTPRKLLTSLAGNLGSWAHVQAFIGKVQYMGGRELLDFGKSVFQSGLAPASVAETLLVKRTAFNHEKEVRLIYFERQTSASDLFRYNFDPHVVIDQIMIDPRMEAEAAETLKREIRAKTLFTGKIKRSLLYAPPDGFVIPIG